MVCEPLFGLEAVAVSWTWLFLFSFFLVKVTVTNLDWTDIPFSDAAAPCLKPRCGIFLRG